MIYQIVTDEGKRKRFAYAIGITEWPKQTIYCTACKRTWNKSLMHEFGTDIPVVLSNDYYPDFLWYYIDHISEKAKSVMETENITGVVLEEAHILSANALTDMQKKELRQEDGIKIKKIPQDPPKYYKLHVEIGAKYHEKTNIILKESCDQCGYKDYIVKGKEEHADRPRILKKESLTGNDLFMSEGYGETIFCTERFREVYEKHSLTGLLFEEVPVI